MVRDKDEGTSSSKVYNLSTLLWNVEGLNFILSCGILGYFQQFDIVLLTESFRTAPTALKEFYTYDVLAKKEERGRPFGGLLIAVKPHLKPREVSHSDHFLVVSTLSCNVILCYFNPKCDSSDFAVELVQAFSGVDLSKPSLVCGDFNARLDKPNSKTEDLLELLNDFGFNPLNSSSCPTYYGYKGSSVIDLYFSNFSVDSIILERNVEVIHLRKHIPVICSFKTEENIEVNIVSRKLKREVKDIDNSCLEDIERSLGEARVDDAYNKLCQCILNSVEELKPIEHVQFRSRQIAKQKVKLNKLFLLLPSNDENMQRLYSIEKARFKTMIKEFKLKRNLNEETKRLECSFAMPWKFRPKRNGSVPCKIPLNEWEAHFSLLYNPGDTGGVDDRVEHDYDVSVYNFVIEDSCFEVSSHVSAIEHDYVNTAFDLNVMNREFSVPEIENVLKHCSDKKAGGVDGVVNEHLKGSFHALGYLWCMLFNLILLTGDSVAVWKQSVVKVLYKGKGSLVDVNFYRGIALLCHAHKLFTKLITRRITEFVERRTLPPEQFGFRQGRSTVDALFKLRSCVLEAKSDHRPVYSVMVDFKKAFDMVRRDMLMKKLVDLHGIRGPMLKVVFKLLEFNFIKVFDGVSFSEDILQTRGVQQGDSLSPLLFILFIADLPNWLKKENGGLKVCLFADDLIFYSSNIDDIYRALISLEKYCLKFCLEVNLAKTNVLKFRNGGNTVREEFMFNNEIIQHCSSYEYLGFTLQPLWTFSKHIRRRKNKTLAAIFSNPKLHLLSIDAAVRYFHVLISPILIYGVDVWWYDLNHNQIGFLDSCWCDFFKRVLGLPRNTRNRLVMTLIESPLLSEYLVTSGRVRSTNDYLVYKRKVEDKLADIDCDYFLTPAFLSDVWKHPNYLKRSLVIRASTHGFHHKLCIDITFHERSENCVCKFCKESCMSLLHVFNCDNLSDISLNVIDNFD